MCVHLTHCVSVPLQHELPPWKSRAIAMQAHGCCRRRRSEPPRRTPYCSSSRPSGCESLPLRAELEEHCQNEEAGLWHHQKPTPKQGESLIGQNSDTPTTGSGMRTTFQLSPDWLCYLMEFLWLFWIPMYSYCSLMCWRAASLHEIWSKLKCFVSSVQQHLQFFCCRCKSKHFAGEVAPRHTLRSALWNRFMIDIHSEFWHSNLALWKKCPWFLNILVCCFYCHCGPHYFAQTPIKRDISFSLCFSRDKHTFPPHPPLLLSKQ